jgi:hypothetical protein
MPPSTTLQMVWAVAPGIRSLSAPPAASTGRPSRSRMAGDISVRSRAPGVGSLAMR